jgi:ribosomal protein S18 acetylase RimI-like enzyme
MQIAPAHARRRGIATALLNEALARVGKEHDAIYVYTQIRAWYEARGFTVIEMIPTLQT